MRSSTWLSPTIWPAKTWLKVIWRVLPPMRPQVVTMTALSWMGSRARAGLDRGAVRDGRAGRDSACRWAGKRDASTIRGALIACLIEAVI